MEQPKDPRKEDVAGGNGGGGEGPTLPTEQNNNEGEGMANWTETKRNLETDEWREQK
jgi:hypothetical protein